MRLVAAGYGDSLRVSTNAGQSWSARESQRSWRSVASSADGTRLVAAGPGSFLYTSTDSGSTWTPRHQKRDWQSVASSADGRRIVAAEIDTYTLHLSNDFGVTWVQRGAGYPWASVALSADGSRLAALSTSGMWVGRQDHSTTGITGAVSGGPDESLELQYIGGGQFLPTRHTTGSGTFQID